MKVVFVESPYNTPTRSRLECIRYAQWCCVDAESRGDCCFASHLFFTQFMTEAMRDKGLAYRDEIARRTLATIARYVDIGQTPGMFRERDGSAVCETRTLTGEIRERWERGEWPEGSFTIAKP